MTWGDVLGGLLGGLAGGLVAVAGFAGVVAFEVRRRLPKSRR